MRNILIAATLAMFSVAILVWRFAHPSGEIATDLIFGWLAFLASIIPLVNIRWDGVAILGTGLLGLTLVSHYLLRWLYREVQIDAEHPRPVWRIRWTLALEGFVIVMFTAGISATGATHQIAWLCRDEEPLFGRELPNMYNLSSETNLKYVSTAIGTYSDTHNTLPPRFASETHRHSWVTPILPFLNYSDEDIDRSRAWDDPVNAHNFRAVLPELCNPEFRTPPLRDTRGFGLNHYAGNSRIFESPEGHMQSDLSNTLLIGEVNSQFVAWGRPDNSRDPREGINTPGGFGGARGTHGAQFIMLDGSVRMVSEDVDPRVLNAMSEP